MKLTRLIEEFPDCRITGNPDIPITGLTADSKEATKGCLFIAKKGLKEDGALYIREALHSGAAAILTDREDSFPGDSSCVRIVHPYPGKIEAALSARYFGNPSKKLLTVGITGTNGKTTCSFIVKHLLDRFFPSAGLIGTIENIVGDRHYPAVRTTPDVISNHRLLHDMVNAGCRSAVMEVTSHGLEQGRTDKIDFDAAVFSNLTLDHLDYHGTMERYALAKNRLFSGLGKEPDGKGNKKWAIVNQDSAWTPFILKNCPADVLTYGIEKKADLRVEYFTLTQEKTLTRVNYRGETVDCSWPLSGRFNIYNCLAAMGVLLTQGVALSEICDRMKTLPQIKGRLQSVPNPGGAAIYVDYAHTDDALTKVLETLNELKSPKGRLILVFGCGGDRDRTKRAEMAQAAQRAADFSIITSDNPRSEDPAEICREISTGFSDASRYRIEVDRKKAIEWAVDFAKPEDVILIAGKGHENVQIFSNGKIPFDDFQVAAECCRRHAGLSCG